jgi:hypothetical protein
MTHVLPTWLERWLGVDSAASGEGTVWGLDHAWPWAPWVTLLVLAALVVGVVAAYALEGGTAGRVRRGVLAALRLGALGVVLLMIAQWVLTLHRTGLPYVVVMVDDSASMGIIDRYDDPRLERHIARLLARTELSEATRLNLAKALLLDNQPQVLQTISQRYRLRLYWVSETARPQTGEVGHLAQRLAQLQPLGEATRLGDGVRGVLADLRGTPPAAIILLTDGVTTEGETLAEAAVYARRKGVPLFTIGLGSEAPVRDLELSDLLVDEVVFVDDMVNFEFKLTGTGLAGRRVEVRLRDANTDAVLARKQVVVGPDGEPQRLRLAYRPTEVGEFRYTVEVDALPEEIQHANNRQQRDVSVRKEQIRVLLVQAYPNYEFRYLKHMLQRDSTIQLQVVLQDADVEYAAQDPTALPLFPIRRDELFEYDVIIFGDVNPSLLSSMSLAHVADFVQEKGGGLIFVAGPHYTPLAYRDTPLAPLFPIELAAAAAPPLHRPIREGFAIQPTELGLASPPLQLGDTAAETASIWQHLPPVYWLFEAPQWKPAARVLAEHPTRTTADGRRLPVFVLQFVGAGKVLFHATDETWRWRRQVGDVYFARYWVQAIRYLSRAKLLGKDRTAELTSDRREYRRSDPVRLRLRFFDERLAPAADDGVTLMLERPGEPRRQVTLRRTAGSRGIFEGVVNRLTPGSYHAWVIDPTLPGEPSADFVVVAPPGEFERTQMNAAELRQAAETTRGQFFRVDTAGALLQELPPGRQIPIETLPPVSLWNQWPVLLLLLSLLIGEWILRKQSGML